MVPPTPARHSGRRLGFPIANQLRSLTTDPHGSLSGTETGATHHTERERLVLF